MIVEESVSNLSEAREKALPLNLDETVINLNGARADFKMSFKTALK